MPARKRTTRSGHDAVLKDLRAFGLAYPGAHTKSPWPGHLDLAVKDKTFAYLSIEGDPFSISCKLPHSCGAALMLPFTQPTGYGLGKSGWVSAKFAEDEDLPIDMLKAWIDESYRAQAPKKLVASLAGDAPPTSLAGDGAKKTAPATKAGAKKTAPATKAGAKKNARATASKPRARATNRR